MCMIDQRTTPVRTVTCGCCTNGCVCVHHQDVPRGLQVRTCDLHRPRTSERPKRPTVAVGTISEGTLRPEDLRESYLRTLSDVSLSPEDTALVAEIAARTDNDDPDVASGDVEQLAEIIDAHRPAFTYFGALEGDGACIGVWPDMPSVWDAIRDGEIFAGPAPDAVPTDLSLRADVSDHGNMTLSERQDDGTWREVWSVV